jgi:hypothetical protein
MRDYTHGARTINAQVRFGLEMSSTIQLVVRYHASAGTPLPKNIAGRQALSVQGVDLVSQANRARCLALWKTVGEIQRVTIPSGFSLRKRWIRSCTTTRSDAAQVLTLLSKGY